MAIQFVKLNVTGARGPVGPTGPTGPTGGSGNSVASKFALKAIDANNGDTWLLGASGIYGTFTWRTGDYSAQVASDPREGLYIVSAVSGKGATVGCWVRQWDEINGRPEWFGAQVNNSGFDCRQAIMDCYALCPVTELRAADYWIGGTLVLNLGYRKISGAFNPDGYATGNGTRIVSTDGAGDVCHVRPDTTPTTTGGYLRNVTIENICFQHGVTRTLPSVGSEKAGIACLRAEYLIDSRITGCYANEPVIGFSWYALVGTHIDKCRAFRSALFGGGADVFIGFLTTGAVAPGGLIGNQASLYSYQCNATCAGDALGLTADRRVGFWHDQSISDQFHHGPETLGCNIRITGLGETDTTAGSADFFIADAVVDQFTGASFDIQGVGKRGAVRLINPYAGLPAEASSGASPHYGIRLQNIGGNVSIEGGDLYATPNNNSIGISYESSAGVLDIAPAIKIHEFARPIGIDTSNNFDIVASISCHSNTPLSAVQGAVAMAAAVRGRIAVSVVGKTDAYSQGVIGFSTANDKITIDATRIDPACIQGGATNKIVVNSIALTAPGNYTSAGASGTAGNGILVHGITS